MSLNAQKAPAAVMAACGLLHTAIVTEGGDLWACGTGGSGRLGLGAEDDIFVPRRVGGKELFDASVVMAACGEEHTAVVVHDGAVWTSGKGENGRLGTGDELPRLEFTRLDVFGIAMPAVMAACGSEHTIILTAAGDVWVFGDGGGGQLGLGDLQDRFVPTKVSAESFRGAKIGMVAAGAFHSVALTMEGAVFTWGLSIWGALGHKTARDVHSVTAPRELHRDMFAKSAVVMVAGAYMTTAAVTAEGNLFVWGFSTPQMQSKEPRQVGTRGEFGGAKVVTVGMGKLVFLAVTDEGALFTWGSNNCFQMGHGKSSFMDRMAVRNAPTRVDARVFGGAKVVAVDAGEAHASALTDDGALYTWGMAWYEGGTMGDPGVATTGLGHPLEEDAEDDTEEGSEEEAEGQGGWDDNDDCEFKPAPTRIDPQALGGARVGRCRKWAPASQERAMAFCMITHTRLGASSGSWMHTMEPETVRRIVSLAEPWSWPEGRAGELEGLVRLLGGGVKGRLRAETVGEEEEEEEEE